ncbi:phenylalanine--tRNA ligase subunit beta [Paenibacillus psychroresistens]|uniref:Phenylalanine--tRNA ligase beta subunit n=1 Tax=Paenibacillus psychroresistens TaxID=1778678 RepID=A0A6B8RRG8_9BACL|nr:phenylalanine--tRNA ligase subunit beta [Paenibacillus psychroresistens]QGQ97986.1 phenylalanine--tRNA ligase subunit beta [Paenibacillus psychroresistens]
MKVSYQWLSEYVDLTGYTASELAEKLNRSGIEVDVVENRNKGVDSVVVGYVVSREKHPDADKLSVCTIDVGQSENLQIVCGAPNVTAGQKVPVALVGANLPDGLHIKRAKLRGVESQGMICSAKELGLNDRLLPKEIQEGILVLPPHTQVGASVLEVLAINDEVIELDLTPNRSDCLSMIGAAYEIAAILGREVKLPSVGLGSAEAGAAPSGTKAADRIRVSISAPEQCAHYSARLIEGVQAAPSPLWLQNRLMAAGVRPINNIVDVTNYVMLEYGQPLHAFDADALDNGSIDVRLARAGEVIVTLDDVERTLEPHMLLITDGTKPVAIAGVMGGASSQVTASTVRIVLESAKFAGSSVRKTSRQLGLRSESSLRFEKEVNAENVIAALDRAASLIAQLTGGRIAEGIVESVQTQAEPLQIELNLTKVNRYLGTALSLETVQSILQRLHFSFSQQGEEDVLVHVPSRRGDITRDVDLIEEIARLYGYDHIPTTLMNGVTTPGSLTKEQSIRRILRQALTQNGLFEVINYTFTHPDQIQQFPGKYSASAPVALALPMSEERSTLRTSLIPHLLDTAVYNRNRSTSDIAIFEIGKVFLTAEKQLTKLPEERLLLSILMTGNVKSKNWSSKSTKVDFYDLKGIFEKVSGYFGLEGIEFVASAPHGFHPGRTAEIIIQTPDGSISLGTLGQLHPDLQRAHDLDDTYIMELELDTLSKYVSSTIQYISLPRYPAISRDIAVVVSTEIAVGKLQAKVKEIAGALLESIQVFDIFTGERLGQGKKSVALSLVYRHAEHTLTDEEVVAVHSQVVEALEHSFAAELRK